MAGGKSDSSDQATRRDDGFVYRPPSLTRMRFQIAGGLIAGLVLPLVLRLPLQGGTNFSTGVINSLAGAGIAIVVGYFIWRRIYRYATVEVGNYLFWTFGPTFLIIAGCFVFFRFEYNRFIFFSSMILSVGWFLALHLWTKRNVVRRLIRIPGGNVGRLTPSGNILITELETPTLELISFDGAVADLRHDHAPKWEYFIAELTLRSMPVYHYKQLEESITGTVSIESLSENTFGSLLPDHAYLKIKQLIDQAVVVLFLPLTIPVLLVTALYAWLGDGGPILFKQQRMGFRGKPFTAYKFRTMRHDPEQTIHSEADLLTLENDPRITRVGHILRKYRLDELPQMYNILRGEMSWIGPRPEALRLSQYYESKLPYYRYRHAVMPGITGWAQVNQGHVTDVDDVTKKLQYDFYYIKHVSVWLDFIIVLRTAKTMLSGTGSK